MKSLNRISFAAISILPFIAGCVPEEPSFYDVTVRNVSTKQPVLSGKLNYDNYQWVPLDLRYYPWIPICVQMKLGGSPLLHRGSATILCPAGEKVNMEFTADGYDPILFEFVPGKMIHEDQWIVGHPKLLPEYQKYPDKIIEIHLKFSSWNSPLPRSTSSPAFTARDS